jgi:hypothetical protein
MAELQTKPNAGSVAQFLAAITDAQQRADAETIIELMRELSECEPQMWGASIIGFGSYHYVYESGRELDWFAVGLSPRARNLTLYIMSGFAEEQELLARLGKYKTGKSCLYINTLAEVDREVLRELVQGSIDYVRGKYEPTSKSAAPTAKKKPVKKAAAKKQPAKKKAAKKSARRG